MPHDPTHLPDALPAPTDDGAAVHLPHMPVPPIALPSSNGGLCRIDTPPAGFERLIVYAYPLTGKPGVDPPSGWDAIPGARGCTPESCGFRDHEGELAEYGAAVVGLSTQSTGYQQEAARRLRLPFPLLSDARLALADALRLPVFTIPLRPEQDGGGTKTLLKRITLVVNQGVIEHVVYPILSPDRHAADVLEWLRARPARS